MFSFQTDVAIKSADQAVKMGIGVGKKLKKKMATFFETGNFPDERGKLNFSWEVAQCTQHKNIVVILLPHHHRRAFCDNSISQDIVCAIVNFFGFEQKHPLVCI